MRGDPRRHRQAHLADADEADCVFRFACAHFLLSTSANTSFATRIASSAAGTAAIDCRLQEYFADFGPVRPLFSARARAA